MEDKLRKVDNLTRNQFYQASLEVLQDIQQNIHQNISNPEDENIDEMVQNILYNFQRLLSIVYDKYVIIYLDTNQSPMAMQYLLKIIKIEQILQKIDFKDSTLRLCNAYARMGKCCFHSCYYELTLKYLEQASSILEEKELKNSAEYALTMSQLGNYYRFMFKDDQAEECLKESVEIRRKLFSHNSLEVADSLHGLAQLYSDQGLIEVSLKTIDEAIDIWMQIVGINNIKTAKSIYLKGNLYLRDKQTQANLNQAEIYIMQSLEINLKIMGERFQETADCYHSLGKIKSHNLNSNLFEQYFNKSVQILKDIYGQSHASIAILLNNFGRAYFDRKQYDNAVSCFEQSIKIYYQLCGDMHGNLAITLKNCADCHKEMGRYKQAKIDYEKSLQIYKKIDLNFNNTTNMINRQIEEITNNLIED